MSAMDKVKNALHLNKDHTTTTGTSTTHHTTGSTTHNNGISEGSVGPHGSRVANAADPRIDSDLDSTRHTGALGGTSHNAHSGVIGTSHSGLTGTSHSGVTGTSHNTHSSGAHLGNHSGVTGTTGSHGGISNSTNAGPHNSNLLNKVDPTVDSDLSGKGNRTGASKAGVFGAHGSHATPGSGTAQNTAGPHNSDMANKLDPRVDADLDGSKTIGGNKTRQ